MRVAFNLGSAWLAERAAWLPVEKMRCVVEGDRIVAAAAARDFRQWFGGRELGMSGIWGVVTLPEHRGGGLATRAVTELLEEARAKGQPLSVLYPATQRPYRGMGYELAGTMTRHAVALDDLPRGPAGPLTVEEYDAARDLDGVRACYRASVSGHQGADRLGRSGLVAPEDPRAMVQRRRAAGGGGAGRFGHRGIRVVHVRLGSRSARFRVLDQLPAPGGDVGRGSRLVAVVPARVPRSGTNAQVHRAPGSPHRVVGRGAARSARVVVPMDAAVAGRCCCPRGTRVPTGLGRDGAGSGGRVVPREPRAVAGGRGRRSGVGDAGRVG